MSFLKDLFHGKTNRVSADTEFIEDIYGPMPIAADLDRLKDQKPLMRLISENQVISIRKHDSLVIGRSPECNITLVDPGATISRTHCRISADEGDSIAVTDLGSFNGTYLNQKKLEPHKSFILNGGDSLCIGKMVFKAVPVYDPQETIDISQESEPENSDSELEPALLYCTNCGKKYKSEKDKYCRNCGAERKVFGAKEPISIRACSMETIYGPPPVSVNYRCPSCGHQWHGGSNWAMDKYCPECGHLSEDDLPERAFRRYE